MKHDVTENEASIATENLKSNSAPGIDAIPPKFVKMAKMLLTLLFVIVVVWRGISSKTDERTKAEGLSFYHPGHQTAWVRC